MSGDELGTKVEPRYVEADEAVDGDVRMRTRLFTYRTDKGVVAGWTGSLMCPIDRPASVVWPIFKDLNQWHGETEHVYSGVIGDSEGEKVLLHDRSASAAADATPEAYQIERVIPEHVMVFSQPLDTNPSGMLPGVGGVDIGYNVYMLSEFDGRCVANVLMEHASYATWEDSIPADEAIAPWREISPEWTRLWLESFVPALRRLARDSNAS